MRRAGKRRQRVLAREVAEPRCGEHELGEGVDVGRDLLGTDELPHDGGHVRVVGAARPIREAVAVVVDDREVDRHGVCDVRPKGAQRLRRHGHEERMADVGAADPGAGGVPQAVDDARRVDPGDGDLRRDAKRSRLVGEDIDQAAKLVQLDGVELAVGVRRVDAVDTGGSQAAHVLAQHVLVEQATVVERRCDGGPDAVQRGRGELRRRLRHRG